MPLARKILPIFIAVFLTASAIYLTPLKHVNVIEPSIDDIEPREFNALYEKNPDRYIFIDVRSEESYNRLHARGSVNVPLHEMYNERHKLPKKGKEIILICSGGVASGVAYSYLEHYGFFNLKRIAGGIENWAAQGLPVESREALSDGSAQVGPIPGCPRA